MDRAPARQAEMTVLWLPSGGFPPLAISSLSGRGTACTRAPEG